VSNIAFEYLFKAKVKPTYKYPTGLGVFKTEPIQKKNYKPNQSKSKLEKTAFCIRIIFLLKCFGLVCGFDFTNRTKSNQTAI